MSTSAWWLAAVLAALAAICWAVWVAGEDDDESHG